MLCRITSVKNAAGYSATSRYLVFFRHVEALRSRLYDVDVIDFFSFDEMTISPLPHFENQLTSVSWIMSSPFLPDPQERTGVRFYLRRFHGNKHEASSFRLPTPTSWQPRERHAQ